MVALLVGVGLFMRTVTASLSVEVIGLTHEDNPRWWADRPVNNQTSTACAECHEATTEVTTAFAHASVNCDSCHGAAREHIDLARSGQQAPLALADARDLCTTCHAGLDSRPQDFPQVDPATHGAPASGVTASCTSCHNPHDPGFPPVFEHTLEGRQDCLVCHGPDQWQPLPPSHADRTGDSCIECHRPGDGT